MPDFVKSLAYVKEYGCTIFVVFECFEYGV